MPGWEWHQFDDIKRKEVEQKRREGLRRYWASSRSNARRKRQSEWAKTLNRTMPDAVRAANGKKIQAKAIERCKDPKYRKAQSQDPRRHIAANKRTRDLQKARVVAKEWGLYVEDNATQEQLDEFFAIFL